MVFRPNQTQAQGKFDDEKKNSEFFFSLPSRATTRPEGGEEPRRRRAERKEEPAAAACEVRGVPPRSPGARSAAAARGVLPPRSIEAAGLPARVGSVRGHRRAGSGAARFGEEPRARRLAS